MIRLLFGPLGVLAVVGILLAFGYGQTQRLDHAKEKLGMCHYRLGEAQRANDSGEAAIETLRLANAEFEAAAAARERAAQNAAQELAALRKRAAEAAEQVRVEREVIFREPECSELAMLDINAICPPLAESLREWAVR